MRLWCVERTVSRLLSALVGAEGAVLPLRKGSYFLLYLVVTSSSGPTLESKKEVEATSKP